MAARGRAERAPAAPEQVDARRAVACTAGSLLAIYLLAGAGDLGAILYVMSAALPFGQLPDDATLQDVGARRKSEYAVRNGHRSGCFAAERRDVQFHVTPLCSRQRPPKLPAGGIFRASARPWAGSS